VADDLEIADTPASRGKGLLGRSSLPPRAGLWIVPCAVLGVASIHMFGMKFAIDVIYLDREQRVVKLVHDLAPWRLSAACGAHSVVELPAGALASLDIQKHDTLEVRDAQT